MIRIPQQLQGRQVRPEEVVWLRESIAANPSWSRKRLAQEVCTAWDWRDGAGRPKDFAARGFLLKLAGVGAITLPALRWQKKSRWCGQAAGAEPMEWAEPAVWASPLAGLRPLSVEVVAAGSPAHRSWSFYLTRYHYLGLRVVGENLGYLVRDREGRDVACLLFGAAAWRCAPRDRFLEWGPRERVAQLSAVANNTRFLILPWVKCANLASHVLGAVARRIDADWKDKYRHGLSWLETFVERERFLGTCYRAANWRCVGQTTGRSRQDRHREIRVPIKDVYVFRLEGRRP